MLNLINTTSILIILVLLAVIIGTTVLVVTQVKKRKTQNTILNELNIIGPTKLVKKEIYDYELDTKECIYLIKVVYNYRKLEISVNSKNYWQLNDKIVSSKKGGTKLLGIYDLINADLKFSKPIKKVYLIYPDAKVLVKAVNESELSFIYPNTDCYGVNLIKFTELKEITKI